MLSPEPGLQLLSCTVTNQWHKSTAGEPSHPKQARTEGIAPSLTRKSQQPTTTKAVMPITTLSLPLVMHDTDTTVFCTSRRPWDHSHLTIHTRCSELLSNTRAA
jgi:hypothetical protein